VISDGRLHCVASSESLYTWQEIIINLHQPMVIVNESLEDESAEEKLIASISLHGAIEV
jgi:hypothetical protein